MPPYVHTHDKPGVGLGTPVEREKPRTMNLDGLRKGIQQHRDNAKKLQEDVDAMRAKASELNDKMSHTDNDERQLLAHEISTLNIDADDIQEIVDEYLHEADEAEKRVQVLEGKPEIL